MRRLSAKGFIMQQLLRASGGALVALALVVASAGLAAAGPRALTVTDLPRPKPVDLVKASQSSAGEALGNEAKSGAKTKAAVNPAAKRCLAQALYFEARGESAKGQIAVGRVILNRVKDKRFPDTVCGVVFQNASRHNACQFSFACDGKPEKIKNRPLWHEIVKRADWLLSCRRGCADTPIWKGLLWNSTHYHATYVKPGWAKSMRATGRIGAHVFFYERKRA